MENIKQYFCSEGLGNLMLAKIVMKSHNLRDKLLYVYMEERILTFLYFVP